MKKSVGSTKSGVSTKEKILDAAEDLFSWNGYHGVSLRDIAAKANVKIALPNYHFGTKLELLHEVVGRRSAAFCDETYASLDRARAQAGGGPVSVEAVIEAYITPLLQIYISHDPGWRNYARLLGNFTKLAVSGELKDTLEEYFDPLGKCVVDYLVQSLPACPRENIYWSFFFLHSTMVHILGEAILGEFRTVERISGGLCDTSNVGRLRDALVPFFAAGFYRLAGALLPDRPGAPAQASDGAAVVSDNACTGPASSSARMP